MQITARLCVVFLAVACATAGCDSTDNAPAEPMISVAAIPDNVGAMGFPLDAYEVTDEQQRQVSRAYELLLSRCLDRFGVHVPVGEPAGKPHHPLNIRFGLIDESVAEKHGYAGVPAPRSSNRPFLASVPPDAKWLLTGEGESTFAGQEVPPGGCQDEALRKLNSRVIEVLKSDIVERLIRESIAKARQDSRVKALVVGWRSCMRDSGYQYEDPADAERHWNQVHAGRRDAALTDEETVAGLADVRCKKETGLLRTWAAAIVAYETMFIERNVDALRRSREMTDATIRNAAAISANG